MSRPETEKAELILEYARETRDAFKTLCDTSRQARRASGGATTYSEQDLLRAMLVFSAAGLDALLKQLIRDALRPIARNDQAAQQELETFVVRSIRGDVDLPDQATGRKFLAHVLVAAAPLDRIVEDYVRDLTGDSLQSPDQLFTAVKALGLDPAQVGIDGHALKKIFEARNQIVHDMDIRLDAPARKSRKRRSRQVDVMIEQSTELLNLGQRIIEGVERKLRGTAT